MTQLRQLLETWQTEDTHQHPTQSLKIDVPVATLAKIRALGEMYPGRSEQQIINDLLHAALHDIEEAMPYVAGRRVIAQDEFGDDIFEDTGPGPRFQQLTHKHLQGLDGGE